jgi:ribosomal protein S21
MINVEIERNGNENSVSLLKRFTRRVQGSQVLNTVRGKRYSERKPSEYTKKKKALKVIEYRKKMNELAKLGKLPEKPTRK